MGSITAEIKLSDLHAGQYQKSITVTSNAKNESRIVLTIKINYRKIVEIEPVQIRLSSEKGKDTGAIVTLTTIRKDFQLTGISFKEYNAPLDWKPSILLNYAVLPSDTAKVKQQDSAKPVKSNKDTAIPVEPYIYKVKITYTPTEKDDKNGDFIFQTNLPEKPEVRISGTVEAKRP